MWRSRIWTRSLYVENDVSSSACSSAGSIFIGAVTSGSDGAALSWGPCNVVGCGTFEGNGSDFFFLRPMLL